MEESAVISPMDSSVIVQLDLVGFNVKQVGNLAWNTWVCVIAQRNGTRYSGFEAILYRLFYYCPIPYTPL